MDKNRLEQMVKMLRELPEDGELGFNIDTWFCSTTACAVGHACMRPEFNSQGLHKHPTLNSPAFGTDWGFDAVESFFDLNHIQATYLFSPEDYEEEGQITAAQVADRIEDFIGKTEVVRPVVKSSQCNQLQKVVW